MARKNRAVSFKLHIAPLFSDTDVKHMSGMIDLSNYADVRDSADSILSRLRDEKNPMPPAETGGPWPDEWIALFARWVAEGKKP